MEQHRWFSVILKKKKSIKLDLPEVKELGLIYDRVVRQQEFEPSSADERNRVVEAARGLT